MKKDIDIPPKVRECKKNINKKKMLIIFLVVLMCSLIVFCVFHYYLHKCIKEMYGIYYECPICGWEWNSRGCWERPMEVLP